MNHVGTIFRFRYRLPKPKRETKSSKTHRPSGVRRGAPELSAAPVRSMTEQDELVYASDGRYESARQEFEARLRQRGFDLATVEIHGKAENAPLLEALSKFASTAGNATKSLRTDDIFAIYQDLRRHEQSRPDECKRPEPLDVTRYFEELAKSKDFDRAVSIEREAANSD